jgi:hypothetical protein
MKLGTETNSLTNHIYSRMTKGQPEPEVGMGATILCWTDRNAATIVDVWTFRKLVAVTVQEDTATRADKNGISESQDWKYEPNPNGAKSHFARTESGAWREIMVNGNGRFVFADGHGLRIGERESYRDFSF